jgi:hypothetical protein
MGKVLPRLCYVCGRIMRCNSTAFRVHMLKCEPPKPHIIYLPYRPYQPPEPVEDNQSSLLSEAEWVRMNNWTGKQ